MKKRNIVILLVLVLLVTIPVARWCVERQTTPGASIAAQKKADYYYCPMHPWFHQDHPGNCGICGMTLVKRDGGAPQEEATASTGEKAMVPEALKGLGQINLSPWKQQLIGLRTAVAEKKPVIRIVRTVGRVAGGSDDFAAAAGDFAAQGTTAPAGGRFLVVDVYALDIPYVKVGQKAWVSSFSGTGSRVEGRVAQIYPYDGTQSRVRRVRVSVPNLPSSELFANVEIEAVSQPFLSVPADAVMTTGLQRYVFIEKSPEIFEPRAVTVGFEGDNDWQITSGLNGGETVVVGANFMVDADSKLKANFDAMDAQEK